MDISFLNKQFLLMANITKEYQKVRQTKQWSQLQELLILKKEYLQNLIINSPKERLKKTTWQSLENLENIMNCQF